MSLVIWRETLPFDKLPEKETKTLHEQHPNRRKEKKRLKLNEYQCLIICKFDFSFGMLLFSILIQSFSIFLDLFLQNMRSHSNVRPDTFNSIFANVEKHKRKRNYVKRIILIITPYVT